MNIHPVANLFPMMNNDEYAALVADIHQHGQREPIWILDNAILDGRNRWQACGDLGIQPITRDYCGDTNTASLISFVVSLNLKRRQMMRECLFPAPLSVNIVTNTSLQYEGVDIIATANIRVQVKVEALLRRANERYCLDKGIAVRCSACGDVAKDDPCAACLEIGQ